MTLQGVAHADGGLERVDILGVVLYKERMRFGI
jgi:hypothetical protein